MQEQDQGLHIDLARLLHSTAGRRQALRWMAVASMAPLPLLGCDGGATSSGNNSGSTGSVSDGGSSGTSGSCAVIPEETAGPYPGDGSNSNGNGIVNALQLSGIVRRDIRSSVGGASGVAEGVPLTITLKLRNNTNSCANLAGFAVYLWHCTREGLYSMYSSSVLNENFLRGVQESDANGELSFDTIFPGCYDGRMPHVHFEIYPSLAQASSAANQIKTSQLTFPLASINEAYTASGYASSVSNLGRISFASDNVFSDGTSLQMCTVSGNANQGYVATLELAIAA
ncbi:intradiol ring-cleavage dioxygenase [Chitinimonas taiwanensis]|uniref:Uncharacterized protein n=1 Tax=Chitinimonas taiwanensis DSM 18899 TaxID=1121279 RepID=A0A1K2HJ30_9NEIS|nr:intradiol ring-cleavage dioxygenase [Chitinimonas taiwanensis]SFZ76513.1 hypothetical protein SAMN02745887_01987 [Chitinimonas taiwanensis DSM 18899]